MKETTTTKVKDVQRVIIVAFAKYSSILEDITELDGTSAFKGNVKRDINRFTDLFDRTTSKLYRLYYKERIKLFEELITQFDNFDQQCDISPESNARMILVYSKLLSINMDLYSITMEDDKDTCMLARLLSSQIEIILNKKFWNMYKTVTDSEGNGIESLTSRIHQFGRMIYLNEVEITEEKS